MAQNWPCNSGRINEVFTQLIRTESKYDTSTRTLGTRNGLVDDGARVRGGSQPGSIKLIFFVSIKRPCNLTPSPRPEIFRNPRRKYAVKPDAPSTTRFVWILRFCKLFWPSVKPIHVRFVWDVWRNRFYRDAYGRCAVTSPRSSRRRTSNAHKSSVDPNPLTFHRTRVAGLSNCRAVKRANNVRYARSVAWPGLSKKRMMGVKYKLNHTFFIGFLGVTHGMTNVM